MKKSNNMRSVFKLERETIRRLTALPSLTLFRVIGADRLIPESRQYTCTRTCPSQGPSC
jgi:hypothetical protein